MKHLKKRKIERYLLLSILAGVKASSALLVSWLNSLWLIPLATYTRGGETAYGSEYLLIGVIFCLTYYVVSQAIKKWLNSD